jgi:hypothetical protein
MQTGSPLWIGNVEPTRADDDEANPTLPKRRIDGSIERGA